MKIVQVYKAGHVQADLIAQGLREAGYETYVYRWNIPVADNGPCNVVHAHGAPAVSSRLNEWSSYVQHYRALPLIQYETSEIRSRSDAVRNNFYAHLDDRYHELPDELLKQMASVFPGCIVESAEAAEYAARFHRRVYIVPLAIRLPKFDSRASLRERLLGRKTVVAHFAADESKGGEFIEKAISGLQNDGYDIQYARVRESGGEEAMEQMAKADIVIDQLLHGSYSLAAIEAMAMGKPVLSHLREDLRSKLDPELPIVSANPATLYRQLIPLLDNAELRRSLGERGRMYVQKHHAIEAVIPKLLAVYRHVTDPRQDENVAFVFDLVTGKAYPIERAVPVRGPEPSQPVGQPQEGGGLPEGAAPAATNTPSGTRSRSAAGRSRRTAGRASRKRRRSSKRSRSLRRRKLLRGRRRRITIRARAIGRSSRKGSKKRGRSRPRRRLAKAGAVRGRRARRRRMAG